MRIETCTRLYHGAQADNLIGREQNLKLGYFLVIEQHEPADGEEVASARTSASDGSAGALMSGEVEIRT